MLIPYQTIITCTGAKGKRLRTIVEYKEEVGCFLPVLLPRI